MSSSFGLSSRTLLRITALVLFVGTIVLFRGLAILVVFFVAFERLMGAGGLWLHRRARVPLKVGYGAAAMGILGTFAGALTLGVLKGVRTYLTFRDDLPERIEAVRQSAVYGRLRETLGEPKVLLEKSHQYAHGAVGALERVGHATIYVVVAFILALIFHMEHEELVEWRSRAPATSLSGTLLRWFGYVADAIAVTLQFQVVVAAVNAVLTLPILLVLGLPHVPTLVLLIFFSGLVPVAGNFLAGLVLTLIAFQERGVTGLVTFVVLTFILHKIESYFLTPRLAQKHVRLPGFMLVVSLVAWEHLLGFRGLFVSFPFLFVASKLKRELAGEEPPSL